MRFFKDATMKSVAIAKRTPRRLRRSHKLRTYLDNL
jgi:hypothetical protein